MPAGYVMTMDSEDAVRKAMTDGIYGTVMKGQPGGEWDAPREGTFADFATMRAGDNIYFFHNRQLYGIGELTEVQGECAHLNFPGASEPTAFDYAAVQANLLYDTGERSVRMRWICTFRPGPRFFKRGVDMDEALEAHPSAFRMLRVLWKLSFIELDHEENAALKEVILRVNREALVSSGSWTEDVVPSDHERHHATVASRRTTSNILDVRPFLRSAANGASLKREKALEAAILFYLARQDPSVEAVFGRWDYLSHQVAASPFKPPDWMDKIDIFGAAFIPAEAPHLAGLLVAELKKDVAGSGFVEQVMKYVDWVRSEYAHEDYSLIRAFLVAQGFDDDALRRHQELAYRLYAVRRRPPETGQWSNLTLVKYRYLAEDVRLDFQVAATPRRASPAS